MSVDVDVEWLKKQISAMAVAKDLGVIPRLHCSSVEFVVPKGADAKDLAKWLDMNFALCGCRQFEVNVTRNDKRIRIFYKT